MKSTSIHIITSLLLIFILCAVFIHSHCQATNKTENDNIFFIRKLYNSFNIDTPFVFTPGNILKIDTITLYGSYDNFIIIEYDYPEGSMSDYPWKIQFLTTTEYKPVKYFQAERYELIKVFPDQSPLLLILNVTGKGNGWHEVYRMNNDTCINICEPGELIQTYDAHEDHDLYHPAELQLTIEDYNKDGFNDLIFKGTHIYHDPPERTDTLKSEPIEYIFLYNPETELFKLQKNKVFFSDGIIPVEDITSYRKFLHDCLTGEGLYTLNIEDQQCKVTRLFDFDIITCINDCTLEEQVVIYSEDHPHSYFISGIPGLKEGVLYGITKSGQHLFPDTCRFELNDVQYELFTTLTYKEDYWSAKDVHVYFKNIETGVCQELAYIKETQDQLPFVVFITDLDGDGLPDLILSDSHHYEYYSQLIFLSSCAEKGELVKAVGTDGRWRDC